MLNRLNVVEEARTWLEVPWVHQGRSIYGVDCAGLIVVVAKKLGLMDAKYDKTNYQRSTTGTDFLKPFKELFDQKPILQARPGDIMLFRDAAYPCHSTIVGERRGKITIIHANRLMKKVVEEDLDQGTWLERRVACFEFRGLDNG